MGSAADIRAISNALNRAKAEVQLRKTIEKYTQCFQTGRMVVNQHCGWFNRFSFPEAHWRRIRTVNRLERVGKEIRRRTWVVCIFPTEASG